MYFHIMIGTGSYITSTTNMYNKDFTYPPAPKGLESHSPLSHSCRGSLRVTWAEFRNAVIDINEQSQSKNRQQSKNKRKKLPVSIGKSCSKMSITMKIQSNRKKGLVLSILVLGFTHNIKRYAYIFNTQSDPRLYVYIMIGEVVQRGPPPCTRLHVHCVSVLSWWMGRVVAPMNDTANVPWIVFPSTCSKSNIEKQSERS